MLIRVFFAILALTAIGCESMTTSHQASHSIPSGPPLLTLASLSQPEIQDQVVSSDRGISDASEQAETRETDVVDPFPTVFFSYDSWEISPDVQNRLGATAKWMSRFPDYGLTIEGHTDIRGTESYNMILGGRRAKAVKEYLANLGVPRQRLETVSYGKTLAVCDKDDEHTCHQFNRRADLLLE